MARAKYAIGNWKMNGTRDMATEIKAMGEAHANPVHVVICPPATLLSAFCETHANVAIGAQDCHMTASGAHTGDVSAAMIAETGATYVIIGHSERRTDHGEANVDIAAKAQQALAAGLTPILCVGETEQERDDGRALDVVTSQIRGSTQGLDCVESLILAYEPVWAIGTGRVPTTEQIAEMFAHIDGVLADIKGGSSVSRLYGGSVKGSNAAEIFAIDGVDGALVGGASLTAEAFVPIMTALSAA